MTSQMELTGFAPPQMRSLEKPKAINGKQNVILSPGQVRSGKFRSGKVLGPFSVKSSRSFQFVTFFVLPNTN
jgi:hypothetical protein